MTFIYNYFLVGRLKYLLLFVSYILLCADFHINVCVLGALQPELNYFGVHTMVVCVDVEKDMNL